MKRSHLIIIVALILFFGWVAVSDGLVRWFGLSQAWQYAYNISYFICCPIVIYKMVFHE